MFNYKTTLGSTLDPLSRDVLYYSLDQLDDARFYRRPSSSRRAAQVANFLLERRIKNLRKQYDYIRLWFSGGKDSMLALNTAIKHGVFIDEIVVIRRQCRNGPDLWSQYSQSLEIQHALDYLDRVKSNLSDTKISVIDIDDPHHESIFEDPEWYRNTTEWFFNIGYSMNMFYRYINPEFHLLENITARCDLCGAAVPRVVYDNNIGCWKFNFVDSVFVTAHGGGSSDTVFEDFLITAGDPILLEFFVNSIIDDIEFQYSQTGIFDTDKKLSSGDYQRLTRDRSAIYKTPQIINYQQFQFDKECFNIEYPSDDFFWRVDPGYKVLYDLVNRYYQTPIPRCLQLYSNTPWDIIKNKLNNRTFTKTWNLNRR